VVGRGLSFGAGNCKGRVAAACTQYRTRAAPIEHRGIVRIVEIDIGGAGCVEAADRAHKIICVAYCHGIETKSVERQQKTYAKTCAKDNMLHGIHKLFLLQNRPLCGKCVPAFL
jgi:hypothetical protein